MKKRQFVMRRYDLDELPPVEMPEGCSIRTYRPGDEEAWGEIMNTGVGSDWDVEKVKDSLINQPQFDPEGLFFVFKGDKPVGSACAWKSSPSESKVGIVHMVCVLPEARGLNLGYLVTLQVLYYLRDHGFREVYLNTDDFRIPAIKSYLRLGFKPFHLDLTHFHRWKSVLAFIGW